METIQEYMAKSEEGWKLLGPCSEFAQSAWDVATQEYLNANTLIIINNPATLKKSIIDANGGNANGTLEVSDSSIDGSSIALNSLFRSYGSVSASSGLTSNSSIQLS